MEIGPLHNNKPQPPAVAPKPESTTGASEKAQRSDSVELSLDARQKLTQLADTARSQYGLGEMPPRDDADSDGGLRMDKIRQARQRIDQGFYDQPHVRQEIAGKLANEMSKFTPGDSD
ncbi:MAG: hypothetical protein KOO62_01970 [candidate division Zixibacteria bacterium]|nr:hypothetical protein [candidate division Zixibacteria bacterium]